MGENPSQRPIRVSYEATSGARETTTGRDLSLGGIFIETSQKSPAVGSFVTLEIESGTTKVNVDGRVLSAAPGGFSVGFIDLPNEVASALHFILATRVQRRGTTLGLGESEEGVPKYVSERSLPSASGPPSNSIPIEEAPPRNPTPRMVPVAPPAAVPPPATSSSPAVVPLAAPPSAPRPPPMAPMAMPATPAPSSSRTPLVLVAVGAAVLLLVIGIVAVLIR